MIEETIKKVYEKPSMKVLVMKQSTSLLQASQTELEDYKRNLTPWEW